MPTSPPRSWQLPREGQYWLIVAVLLFIVGWIKGINLLLLLAYFLLALSVLNAWALRRGLPGLSGRRARTSGPIFAGQSVPVAVEVQNHGSQPHSGFFVVDAGPTHRLTWLRETPLAPGQTDWFRDELVFPRRGRLVQEPLRVLWSQPFGLVQRVLELEAGGETLILPHLGVLQIERFRQWLIRQTRGDGRALGPPVCPSPEAVVHGLRDYRPGDSPRWIHWKTTARRGKLMVREFEEPPPIKELVLVVEPWLSTADALEATISLAATLCWEWGRHCEESLALVLAGEEPIVLPLGTGVAHALRAMELLAVVEGVPASAREPVVAGVANLTLPRTPVLLLSSWAGSPLREALSSTPASGPFRVEPRSAAVAGLVSTAFMRKW